MRIYVKKHYFSESEPNPVRSPFFKQFRDVLDGLSCDFKSPIGDILGALYDSMEGEILRWDTSTYPYIQNQSGEWIPYDIPVPDSKLRKR